MLAAILVEDVPEAARDADLAIVERGEVDGALLAQEMAGLWLGRLVACQ